MKHFFLFPLGILVSIAAQAQLPKESLLRGKIVRQGQRYAKTITTDDLKNHLYVLAADSLEGRDTGSKGQQKAAAYIRNHFQAIGLQPVVETPGGKNFFQSFVLERHTHEEAFLTVDGKRYVNFEEFIDMGDALEERRREVVFVGWGDESDYVNQDVQAKAVLIFVHTPGEITTTYDLAKKKGADVVMTLLINPAYTVKNVVKMAKQQFISSMILPTNSPLKPSALFLVSQELAARTLMVDSSSLYRLWSQDSTSIIATLKASTAKPIITAKSVQKIEPVPTENVLGYLEGTDKKEEVIVASAHYDHVGIGTSIKGDSIYNGADDDGSGTVSVMEIAKAFARAKQQGHGPRRSMLFLTVTGEEKGLFGSQYYVNHPVFPLKNTITDLNIDMIGRSDSAHQGNPDYLYVVGADRLSTELHQVNEAVNARKAKLAFDYKYNAKDDPEHICERSDHYNFAKNGIPIIFYTSGLHADYHQPSDSPDKIDYAAMKKRAQAIFYTAWELANRQNPVKVDVVSVNEKKP